MIGAGDAEGATQGFILFPLGGLERRRLRRPPRRRIHHRRVEEESEEIVRKIVMLGNVAAGGFAGVGSE